MGAGQGEGEILLADARSGNLTETAQDAYVLRLSMHFRFAFPGRWH